MELLAAFDYCDRSTESRGQQQSWSMTQATIKRLPDGEWHDFELTGTVPVFDKTRHWARPIFGFDATWDPAPGQAQLRNLRLEVPDAPGRQLPVVETPTPEWEWQRGAEEQPGDFQYGQVWEWTESERDDGHNRFVMVRGGCEWRAVGSIWYFSTGPQPAGSHAKFLLMYPGYDRCATIGFRCVSPLR